MEDKKPIFVPPLDNTPAYNMIRAFGRKNWNVVSKYIEIFSKEGDIVYDPFGGSGVVAYEGLKLNRKVIYNDLNPVQYFTAKNLCTPVDLEILKQAHNELVKILRNNEYKFKINNSSETFNCGLDWFLTTKCGCGKNGVIDRVYYDDILIYNKKGESKFSNYKELKKSYRNNVFNEIKKVRQIYKENLSEILKTKISHFNKHAFTIEARLKFLEKNGLINRKTFVPYKIKYTCSCSTKAITKDLDVEDKSKTEKINELISPFYIPNGELYYKNSKRFITRRKVDNVADLFTKRNLMILSVIRKEILSLQYPKEVIDCLMLCFISILFDTSIMKREGAGAWGAKEYWIPTSIVELNPVNVFTKRFEITKSFGRVTGILAGKKEIIDALNGNFIEGNNIRDLLNDHNALFLKADARDIYYNEKIDYIFTDPSYGDAIQYGELTFMATNWLNEKMQFKKEIIVNKNQDKTIEIYTEMLRKAFEQMYLSLKSGKYLTVTFHSRKASIWNALLYAINCNNFEYVDAIYQPKPKEHSNFIYKQKPGAMQGDIYITFKKTERLIQESKGMTMQEIIDNHIIPEANKLIQSKRNKSVTFDQLVRAITLRLMRHNLLHRKEIANIDYTKLFDKYFDREELTSMKKKKAKSKKLTEIKKITKIEEFYK